MSMGGDKDVSKMNSVQMRNEGHFSRYSHKSVVVDDLVLLDGTVITSLMSNIFNLPAGACYFIVAYNKSMFIKSTEVYGTVF